MPTLISFSRELGIDLGTTQTRIADSRMCWWMSQPSSQSSSMNRRSLPWARKPRRCMGRVSEETIEVAHPLQNGVVADYEVTEALLDYLLRQVSGSMRIFRPRVMISVPYGVTSVKSARCTKPSCRLAPGMPT